MSGSSIAPEAVPGWRPSSCRRRELARVRRRARSARRRGMAALAHARSSRRASSVPATWGPCHYSPNRMGDLGSRCLSVVMPCYNERNTIEEIVGQVLASPLVAELVVVDDGSTDGTREVLRSFTEPRIRVIEQPINLGKGAALRRGLRRGHVALRDRPGRRPRVRPRRVPRRRRAAAGGPRRRRVRLAVPRRSPHRVLYYWHSVGNNFLTTASNMFTNLNLTDMETCYKAFRREVIQDIEIRGGPLRVRARDHREGRRGRLAHLRGRDLLRRPHLRRGQEDRLARRACAPSRASCATRTSWSVATASWSTG